MSCCCNTNLSLAWQWSHCQNLRATSLFPIFITIVSRAFNLVSIWSSISTWFHRALEVFWTKSLRKWAFWMLCNKAMADFTAETKTDTKVTIPNVIRPRACWCLFSWVWICCRTWTPASVYQGSEMLAGIKTKEGWCNTSTSLSSVLPSNAVIQIATFTSYMVLFIYFIYFYVPRN